MEYIEDNNCDPFGFDSMTMSDFNISWTNPFDNQDMYFGKHKSANSDKDPQNICFLSDLYQPRPQRSSFDEGSLHFDENEFEEHHLESALRDMMDNGELENFLRDNTVSLREIQDDINICYGNIPDVKTSQSQPRSRRHSIGVTDDLIRCPYPGCDKIFNRAYNFKSHLKTHSCEKPFKCGHCELGFARSHDLKRHEKIHIRALVNPNKCDFCNKTFSRPDALSRHIKLNTCQNLSFKRAE